MINVQGKTFYARLEGCCGYPKMATMSQYYDIYAYTYCTHTHTHMVHTYIHVCIIHIKCVFSVYLSVCVYVYICVFSCILCVCVYIYIYLFIYIYYIYTHISVCACACACVCVFVLPHASLDMYEYISRDMHVCIHTHARACTHTNFQKFVCWFVVIFSLVWCNCFVKSYISKCSQFCVEYDKKIIELCIFCRTAAVIYVNI